MFLSIWVSVDFHSFIQLRRKMQHFRPVSLKPEAKVVDPTSRMSEDLVNQLRSFLGPKESFAGCSTKSLLQWLLCGFPLGRQQFSDIGIGEKLILQR
jgi:hypothetical protein